MLEIEVKYPVAELALIEQRLRALGAAVTAPRQDADQYFNAPDRDFARTDEALRLRRIGPANFVTYKGPKSDALTKTRTEIEVPLAEGDAAAEAFARLLTNLQYRPVAVVRKQRVVCHLWRDPYEVEICLDDVAGVGRFVELEILAPPESLEPARKALFQLGEELGLTVSERRSYLELLLQNTARQP